MADNPVTYTEPAVLWRLRHRDGDRVHATLIPGVPDSTLVYFLNGRFERGENFAEWGPAVAQAEQVRQRMRNEGWEDD